MANVLIVGGAGYLGGALTDLLMQSEHRIRVYDSLVYEEGYRKPVDFVRGDVRDWDCLAPHLRWARTVVWLAAVVGDGACAVAPELTVEVNANAVKRLANSFAGRIIFMSTCSVYGAQEGLLDEDSQLNPLSLYAETKLAAEGFLHGRDAMIFRLGTLFGVGDNYSRIRLDLVLNVLVAKACLYGQISVFGGEQYRPLLHVGDAARAIAQNIESEHAGIFNLHSVNVKISDLAQSCSRYFPRLEIRRTAVKFQDSRNYRVSSQRAAAAFGFAPRRSVDDGIGEIKTLIEQGRIRTLASPRHSNQRYLKALLDKPVSPLGFELRGPI